MSEAEQRLLTLDELPSPQHFESQIESRNIPAERVGNTVVEAMLSRTAPVFYGDIRSREMVPFPFSTFITSCKQNLGNSDGATADCVEANDTGSSVDSSYQVYLAQVPILNLENEERSQLENLREDIKMPRILETRTLASINLWMNNTKSRSSTHYDPHHNLLCVVSGCKQVVLWPPTAIPSLYPMPIYGEASNHSSVDLVNPDYSTHSRAKYSSDYSQKVTLHAGDALFIPEGWFHQVDSDDLTIAVNYWWQSSIMSSMSEHMDAYYLRRVMRRLVNGEMDRMLHGASICIEKSEKHVGKKLVVGEIGYQEFDSVDQNGTKVTKVANQKEKIMLDQLKPSALQALHELVSLVHDSVNVNVKIQPVPSTSTGSPSESRSGESKKIASVNLFHLEDDPVADIVWTLKPLELQNVLLAMVYNFPRTLETLILHVLSPVGAEVLTRKFEEIDQQIIIEERNEFYQIFYGVFDDQFAAMDSILNGKESFALQAFRNVLDKYLGVNFDGPKR